MPIRPTPFIVYCPRCRWQKRVAPRSGVMLPGDMPERCPKCDSNALEHQQASGLLGRLLGR